MSTKVSSMDSKKLWRDFEFDYRFKHEDIFGDLISIEGYKQAALNLVLPPEWRRQLDRLNRLRAVYGTTALEGNPLSEAEVDRQIEIVEQEGITLVVMGKRGLSPIKSFLIGSVSSRVVQHAKCPVLVVY